MVRTEPKACLRTLPIEFTLACQRDGCMAAGRLAYLRFALLVPFAAPLLLSLLSLRQPSPSDSSNKLTQAIANAPARAQRYVQDAQAVVSLAIRAVAPQAMETLSPSVPPIQVALAPETHSTDGNHDLDRV